MNWYGDSLDTPLLMFVLKTTSANSKVAMETGFYQHHCMQVCQGW